MIILAVVWYYYWNSWCEMILTMMIITYYFHGIFSENSSNDKANSRIHTIFDHIFSLKNRGLPHDPNDQKSNGKRMSRESAIFFLYLSKEKVLKVRGFDHNSAARSSSSLIWIGGFSPGNLIFLLARLWFWSIKGTVYRWSGCFYWKLPKLTFHLNEIFPGSPHSWCPTSGIS